MEWQSGTPKKADCYVVAIEYPNGMGTMTSATWDADLGWSLDDNIVGFISLSEVIDSAGLEWPEHLSDQ